MRSRERVLAARMTEAKGRRDVADAARLCERYP